MLKAIKVADKNDKALNEYYKLKEQFNVYPTLETLAIGVLSEPALNL